MVIITMIIIRMEVLRNTALLSTSSELYAQIWVGEDEGTTDVS